MNTEDRENLSILEQIHLNCVENSVNLMLKARFNHAVRDDSGVVVVLTSNPDVVNSMIHRKTKGQKSFPKAEPAWLKIVGVDDLLNDMFKPSGLYGQPVRVPYKLEGEINV
jgi:hypothetical protein